MLFTFLSSLQLDNSFPSLAMISPTGLEMSPSIHLFSLSDELLLEIVARVPYNENDWLAMSLVNHKFSNLLATKTLSAKAADIQFPELYKLLSLQETTFEPLQRCKLWSARLERWTKKFKGIAGDRRQLLDIGIALIYSIDLHSNLYLTPP